MPQSVLQSSMYSSVSSAEGWLHPAAEQWWVAAEDRFLISFQIQTQTEAQKQRHKVKQKKTQAKPYFRHSRIQRERTLSKTVLYVQVRVRFIFSIELLLVTDCCLRRFSMVVLVVVNDCRLRSHFL